MAQTSKLKNEEEFFKIQTASSLVKAQIVSRYFPEYARILLNNSFSKKNFEKVRVRFVDLFAGPGIYEDGKHSTPLLVAKAIAEDEVLRKKVRMIFNDKNFAEQLEYNFCSHYPKGTFSLEPAFRNKTVGEDEEINQFLSQDKQPENLYPTLLFYDPWGYKDINTSVLAKFLTQIGNEIFLFVNIKRIHAAIENNYFDSLMEALFPTTIEIIRIERRYNATNVRERLALIVENLAGEFEKIVGQGLYPCPFEFKEEDSNAVSHFVLHLTKHKRGFELAKQIFHELDNVKADLSRTRFFSFDAKLLSETKGNSLPFADLRVPSLSEKLLKEYNSLTLSSEDLYEDQMEKRQYYTRGQYGSALKLLVSKGLITANYNDGKAHRDFAIISKHCILTFP